MLVFVSRTDSHWKCSPFNLFAGEPHKQTVAPEGCILRGTVFIDGITSSVQVGVRGQIEKQVPRQLRGNVVSSVLSTFSIHHTTSCSAVGLRASPLTRSHLSIRQWPMEIEH